MAVVIKCPMCGAQVRVLTEGYVERHDADGRACAFTRTAHSGTRPRLQLTDADRAKSERRKAARVAELAAVKAKVETRAKKPPKPPKPPVQKEECPVCGRVVTRKKQGPLVAHTKPTSGRWCKGGDTPTDAQRARNAKRRSVWTVGAGLPTLGRH